MARYGRGYPTQRLVTAAPAPARMPVSPITAAAFTHGNVASASTGTIGVTGTTWVQGRLYFIVVSNYVSTGSPATPTVAGSTQQLSVLSGSGISRQTFFTFVGDGSTGTKLIDCAGVAQTRIQWTVDELTGADTSGVNGSNALVQVASNVATANNIGLASPLAAFSGARNATWAWAWNQGGEAETVEPSGYTALSQDTSLFWLQGEFKAGQDISPSFTQPNPNAYVLIAAEVRAAQALAVYGGHSGTTLVPTSSLAVPESGGVILVACSFDSAADGTITVTDGTNTYAQLARVSDGVHTETLYLFGAKNVPAGTYSPTVNLSGTPGDGGMVAMWLANRDATNPFGTVISTNPATTNITLNPNVMTLAAGDDVALFLLDTGALRASTEYTPGSGFTEYVEGGSNVGSQFLDVAAHAQLNVAAGSISAATVVATQANADQTFVFALPVKAAGTSSGGGSSASGTLVMPPLSAAGTAKANARATGALAVPSLVAATVTVVAKASGTIALTPVLHGSAKATTAAGKVIDYKNFPNPLIARAARLASDRTLRIPK